MGSRKVLFIYESRTRWLQWATLTGYNCPGKEEAAWSLPDEDSLLSSYQEMLAETTAVGFSSSLLDIHTKSVLDVLYDAEESAVIVPLSTGHWPFKMSSILFAIEAIGKPIVSSPSKTHIVLSDKALQYAILNSTGVPVPRTYLSNHTNPLKSLDESGRTWIVKPTLFANSVGITSAARGCSFQTAKNISRDIENTYAAPSIIQEFIHGTHLRVVYLDPGRYYTHNSKLGIFIVTCPEVYSSQKMEVRTHFSEYRTSDRYYEKSSVVINIGIAKGVDANFLACAIHSDILSLSRVLRLSHFFSLDYIVRNSRERYLVDINPNCRLRNPALRSYAMETFGRSPLSCLLHIATNLTEQSVNQRISQT